MYIEIAWDNNRVQINVFWSGKYNPFLIFKMQFSQAWQGRKRQAHGHHSPSSIHGEWLAIDDQKHNILASLCLASYLAVNWLQKLETKHCVYYAEVISVLMCVCLCVYGISVWFIYNKTKLPFCKMSVYVPYT